jgi:hypothetical protein
MLYGSPAEPNSWRKTLDDHPAQPDNDRYDDERPPVSEAGFLQEEVGAESAEHVLGAMREVDDVEEPEDHREPKR